MRGATFVLPQPHKIYWRFQSTLLMRGATEFLDDTFFCHAFQSTLLMRGATRRLWLDGYDVRISIHAPHARSDVLFDRVEILEHIISIHAPHARSDTARYESTNRRCNISIHAPHARSDSSLSIMSIPRSHFNPRSSCEERLCHFQALICLTSSYIFREPLTSFRKHFF